MARSKHLQFEQIEKLILKLAKHTGWGYTRILGELKKLGVESFTRWRGEEHLETQRLS